ncbi:MAG: Fic family protein [Patescibacteria group bacterium]
MKNINKPIIGRYTKQAGGYKAFTPFPFPPKEFQSISPSLYKIHEEATHQIGKLDGITQLLPDKDFFLLMFVKKDAAYSSQIEGTQATMQDAVVAPISNDSFKLPPDVEDIIHYINAVNYGTERIQKLPLSWRYIREMHAKLMKGARATHHAYPGEFRKTQNWIGGKSPSDATFVPPTPTDMSQALDDLEKFIHADDSYPSLIKAGLLHAQFETIHPFVDGNGRTGRMLITLFLFYAELLELPVLYLSSYFKKHQKLYYQKLNAYHDEDSDVEGWLKFFLEGIIEIAHSSIETCGKITDLRDRDFEKVQKLGAQTASTTLEIVRHLFGQPIVGVAEVIKWSEYSRQGAYNMIERLVKLKILEPFGDSEYGQKYIYADYYELFDDDFSKKRIK